MPSAPPTAILAGSDYIATGVLQGLQQIGLESPRDLSIASFDDMPFAELLHPPLTTVRQPIDQMGRLGVSTLIVQIRGESQRRLIRLPTTLNVRGSVAAVPRRKTTRGGSSIRAKRRIAARLVLKDRTRSKLKEQL